jgi:hypothetical protein
MFFGAKFGQESNVNLLVWVRERLEIFKKIKFFIFLNKINIFLYFELFQYSDFKNNF